MTPFHKYEVQFFTATILEWNHLLKPDKYKDIIIDSLKFMVTKERVYINAFVIMSNHIHIVWHVREPHKREHVQRDLLKFTAQEIKADLRKKYTDVLAHFKVSSGDREYQFWERNALSVPVWTEAVLLQKLDYIHQNPVKAGLCLNATDYYYSSARYYDIGIDDFGFLSHYRY